MSRRKNLEVDEAEFQRVKALIIGKAQRYQLNPVTVSDRLVVSLSEAQLERLSQEVAEAGYTIEYKLQAGYGSEIAALKSRVRRFGSDPPRGSAPDKAVDWANG